MLGAPVNSSIGPPPIAIQKVYDYAGGSAVVYIGFANSNQGSIGTAGNQGILPAITAFTGANPGVITFASAHGFGYDSSDTQATMLPIIAIAGGTGNWVAANGVWVFTPTSATAGTISSAGTSLNTTGFGAITGITFVTTTLAPRTSSAVWAIQKFVYSGAGAILFQGWAQNAPGVGTGDPTPGDSSRLLAGSVGMNLVWDNRANYSYQ
jgi:hypothetical protein